MYHYVHMLATIICPLFLRGAALRQSPVKFVGERLLRALLLQAFYTIRSERQLMEQLDYNLLYRWFVGLGVDDPVWVPILFTKNRDRRS
jgi:transposase